MIILSFFGGGVFFLEWLGDFSLGGRGGGRGGGWTTERPGN